MEPQSIALTSDSDGKENSEEHARPQTPAWSEVFAARIFSEL